MDYILAKVDGATGICNNIAIGVENDVAHGCILHNLMKVAGENGICLTQFKMPDKNMFHIHLWHDLHR